MKVPRYDALNITPMEAIALQEKLRDQIKLIPLGKEIHTIAGVDVSSDWHGTRLYAGVIVFSYSDLTLIEESFAEGDAAFPYIPGLLSFREIPVLLEAFKKLKTVPDILVVDGQGITHPRRLGIAAHLGVVLGLPSIGSAKSRLYGIYKVPEEVGSHELIRDPKTKEILGAALKTRARALPIIVSPGNHITLDESLNLIKTLTQGYRLPFPIREAHNRVNAFRRKSKESLL